MAYDEKLAERVRGVIGPRPDITERKMFGGLAFLLDGKMFCGVSGDELMVRVGPERHQEALDRKNVRPMDFTGRPMKGYVFVEPTGCRTGKAVQPWVEQSMAFVAALDPAMTRTTKKERVLRKRR